MENTNLIICLVLIVCISTFITLLMWRWLNYCSQKENLKHKEKLEEMRNKHSFTIEELRLNTLKSEEKLKEDIEKKLKAEVKQLTKNEISKTITEQIKDLETQIKTLNAKTINLCI